MATPNDTPQTVEIPLTQNQVTIVDEIDSDLADFKWFASFHPGYAGGGKYKVGRQIRKSETKQTTIYMHRVIMERVLNRPLLSTEKVDHANLDTTDNRRSNLRLATHSQNMMNKKVRKDSQSGYKGVSKCQNRWQATISINRKRKHLGMFDTPEDAYKAYCNAAIEFHGEFACFD